RRREGPRPHPRRKRIRRRGERGGAERRSAAERRRGRARAADPIQRRGPRLSSRRRGGRLVDREGAIVVRGIPRIEELQALRAEWDDLLQSSRADVVFLTWEWLLTWWAHVASSWRLHVLTVYEDGRLVGLAPFGIAPAAPLRGIPFRTVQFLGAGS